MAIIKLVNKTKQNTNKKIYVTRNSGVKGTKIDSMQDAKIQTPTKFMVSLSGHSICPFVFSLSLLCVQFFLLFLTSCKACHHHHTNVYVNIRTGFIYLKQFFLILLCFYFYIKINRMVMLKINERPKER